jgi:hypothetical protein
MSFYTEEFYSQLIQHQTVTLCKFKFLLNMNIAGRIELVEQPKFPNPSSSGAPANCHKQANKTA